MRAVRTARSLSLRAHTRPSVDWGSSGGHKPLSHCEAVFGNHSGRGTAYCSSETLQAFISVVSDKSHPLYTNIQEVAAGNLWPPECNLWLQPNGPQLVHTLANDVGCSVPQLSSAISGLDNALWALRAHQQGKSLAALLREYVTEERGIRSLAAGDRAMAYCTVEVPHDSDTADIEARLRPLLQKRCRGLKIWSSPSHLPPAAASVPLRSPASVGPMPARLPPAAASYLLLACFSSNIPPEHAVVAGLNSLLATSV